MQKEWKGMENLEREKLFADNIGLIVLLSQYQAC